MGESSAQSFLAGIDLFVLVAEPAGCPNASLEAMAACLPIVATDVGGMREQVLPGRTGWMPPRGNPRALADALVEAYRERNALPAIGRAGLEHGRQRFSIRRMVDDYAAAFGL